MEIAFLLLRGQCCTIERGDRGSLRGKQRCDQRKLRYDLVSNTKSYRYFPQSLGAYTPSLRDLKRDGGLAGCARSVVWQQDEGSCCRILWHQEGNQTQNICCAS